MMPAATAGRHPLAAAQPRQPLAEVSGAANAAATRVQTSGGGVWRASPAAAPRTVEKSVAIARQRAHEARCASTATAR